MLFLQLLWDHLKADDIAVWYHTGLHGPQHQAQQGFKAVGDACAS